MIPHQETGGPAYGNWPPAAADFARGTFALFCAANMPRQTPCLHLQYLQCLPTKRCSERPMAQRKSRYQKRESLDAENNASVTSPRRCTYQHGMHHTVCGNLHLSLLDCGTRWYPTTTECNNNMVAVVAALVGLCKPPLQLHSSVAFSSCVSGYTSNCMPSYNTADEQQSLDSRVGIIFSATMTRVW